MPAEQPDEWLESLARLHAGRVLGYLRRRTDADTAAEVWQQVLVVAWRRPKAVPAVAELALAWMLKTARFSLANHVRSEVRRDAATARLAESLRHAAPQVSPDPQVSAALKLLPESDRELLRLVYWDDLSTEQAAIVLGVRPAACRKRLQRARESLRAHLVNKPAPDGIGSHRSPQLSSTVT